MAVSNKRYYDAKLHFFYTYSLRTETRESEAGDGWYLKEYDEELWDGRMPEWGGIKTCKKEKPLKVINLWGY